MSYYSTYRWCAVPKCKNTSVKTPKKLWIQVPTDLNMRKTWFKVARRNLELLHNKTRLYFCEDHFDLEHDMENYIKYKIMGSVKRIQLKPNCIPSRFDWNRLHKTSSNECHLAEAKKLRISITKDSVQDPKEDDVKTSLSCYKDSHTTLGTPSEETSSVENKCDKAVQFIQIQVHTATQVVPTEKQKVIHDCIKVQCRSKQVQIIIKIKDKITSSIKFIVSTAICKIRALVVDLRRTARHTYIVSIAPLKTSIKNVTKLTFQSTVSRILCFIEEIHDSYTSCTSSLVGSTVDQDYSPFRASLSKTTLDTSIQV